jgi:hypothetical protein
VEKLFLVQGKKNLDHPDLIRDYFNKDNKYYIYISSSVLIPHNLILFLSRAFLFFLGQVVTLNFFSACEISGANGGEYENEGLLGYGAV